MLQQCRGIRRRCSPPARRTAGSGGRPCMALGVPECPTSGSRIGQDVGNPVERPRIAVRPRIPLTYAWLQQQIACASVPLMEPHLFVGRADFHKSHSPFCPRMHRALLAGLASRRDAFLAGPAPSHSYSPPTLCRTAVPEIDSWGVILEEGLSAWVEGLDPCPRNWRLGGSLRELKEKDGAF